ncbi:MAG: hypothetical protein ABIV50_14540 [Opitutus sp.]
MNKPTLTKTILASKKSTGAIWSAIAGAAGFSEVFTASACLGENAWDAEEAQRVARFLGVPASVADGQTW